MEKGLERLISSANEPEQPGIFLFCKSNFYSFFRVEFNFSLQHKLNKYKSFMIMSRYTTDENVPRCGTIASLEGGGYYQENRLKDG